METVDKESVIAACRDSAWVVEEDPTWEPVTVVDGEQLFRKITFEPQRLIHCFMGTIGADWSLESVEDLIEKADEIDWIDHFLDHNLRVRANDKTYHFQVVRLNKP